MDQGLDRLEKLLQKRLRSGSLEDLRVDPPRRARLILEATALYCEPAFTQTELASILGMSRSAFRREFVRLWRGYLGTQRDCATCGAPLPLESTRRRKFCSVRCRVAHNRRPDAPAASEDSNVDFIIAAFKQIGSRLEEGYTVDQIAQEIGMPKQNVILVRRKLRKLVGTPAWRRAWEKIAAEAQIDT